MARISPDGLRDVASPPYTPWHADPAPVHAWHTLKPTKFLHAHRSEGTGSVVIFPGFGVSVKNIPLDALLWTASDRYHTVVSHHAINYPARSEYLLWQYHALLRTLPSGPINLLGISLGGSTAIQLAHKLLTDDPALYERLETICTVLTPVRGTDLTFQWQRIVLPACKALANAHREDTTPSVVRRAGTFAARILTRGSHDTMQRNNLEATTPEEASHICAHAGETFAAGDRVPMRSLPRIRIAALGLVNDSITANARADAYAADPSQQGIYTEAAGMHDGFFYETSRDAIDTFVLRHLG